jgi:hypothetical protein
VKRRTFLRLLTGGSAAVAGGGGLYLLFRPSPPPSIDPDQAWLAALLPVDVPLRLDADQRDILAALRRARPGFLSETPEARARWVQSLLDSDDALRDFFTELCDRAYAAYYTREPLLPAGYPRFQDPP